MNTVHRIPLRELAARLGFTRHGREGTELIVVRRL